MATMSQTWTIIAAATVLFVQLCAGEKSCAIWSSVGPVVLRGSSFEVYCIFKCKCRGSMYSGHPPAQQSHKELNSTTIYLHVVNVTNNPTYSCECACPPGRDPCGLDISAGYPPDHPKNISCLYKVISNTVGVVFCTWDRGRDTHLRDRSLLWVRTVSGNRTVGPVTYDGSSKETYLSSAGLPLSRSVQLISVWVHVQNRLGSAASVTINYTLGDIAVPPTPRLGQPECSSRGCVIRVKQSVRTRHLDIQYRAEARTWTSYADSAVQMNVEQVPSISCLEPHRLYHFRARSKFSTGLWSPWSSNVSSWTQEEAPAKELDVWYAEPVSDFTSLRVYWKEANISIARGKIIEYKVRVYSQNSGLLFSANISANASNYSVPFCADCEVTVWACNSKGLSPPARITTRHTKANPPEDVQVTAGNHSVTISWRNRETAPRRAAHVVEWYPRGLQLEELRWVRLDRNDTGAVLTGIKPYECYEGAVYAVYNDSTVSSTRFTGVTILESAPAAGPSVQKLVEGNNVKVTWLEISRVQRGGCITSYTLYIENDRGDQQTYAIPASERTYILKDLSSAVYSLWMTASTAKGEGPAGQKVKFFIQQETQLSVLVGVVSVIGLFLLCLCQSSAVKQRFWMLFQCLMLDDVPDPANSEWAKDCIQEKGKMKLHLHPSNSSVTEEEEPILVDVEELPKQSRDICTLTHVSPQLPPQTNLCTSTAPDTLPYPPSAYIKSLSQDSDRVNNMQTSLHTNTPVDYLSSHREESMDEEEQGDEDFVETMGFFPSRYIIEPLEFRGALTLDAVKIDCSDFFKNNNI